ncbi:hypothetical protein JCM10207_004594 [Rhodosporidiobolus poonsookiae]
MQDTHEIALDTALASTLFPAALRLAHLSSSSNPTSDDSFPTQPHHKLELSKQAAQLRTSLATLQQQATQLPAGNLSLEDQDWMVEQLEAELARKRNYLVKMAELTASASGGKAEDAMDTAA